MTLGSVEDAEHHVTDSEDTWGTEAIPSHAAADDNFIDEQQQQGNEADQRVVLSDETKAAAPWWSQAIGWALSPWKKPDGENTQSDVVAEADGSAAYSPGVQRPSWFDEASATAGRGGLPVGDIVFGEDIPLEEIAAEVQKSWKLRDYHVETLVQKALEARQRENEWPLLLTTSIMATASAILLSIVLYRLMNS